MYRELSDFLYNTMCLVLTVSDAWAPEFANLDIRLPGTTNIRVCEINLAVEIPSVTSNPLSDVTLGISRVILGAIKQFNRMPNLETIHIWHSGLIYSSETQFYYPCCLDQELRSFVLLHAYQDTTRYKVPYQGPAADRYVLLLGKMSSELHNGDSTKFGRAFTCHLERL